MRILFASAEVAPFAKTGGLADVALALPRALASLGNDVLVVMPKHRSVATTDLREAARFTVQVAGSPKECIAYRGTLPDSEVPIYFLGHDAYFDRAGIYGEGSEYPDALERFTFLSRGALELCEALGWSPDVVHANDWHTALMPTFTKRLALPRSKGAKSVLTIHNLAYQGAFPRWQAGAVGLGEAELEPYLRGDQLNLLRGGILTADLVNTVSPTYAKEILHQGDGLEAELRSREQSLYGVLNGIDETVWNPERDRFLWAAYGRKSLDGKAKNKELLQEELGLAVDPRAPLVGAISRLAEQKGFDLIMPAFDRMLDLGIQFVVLGSGAPEYERFFREASERQRGRVAALITFSEEWAHRIEAASDVFLMPSRYEPCGLNQQYSLVYGTVPVVRSTGGLKDTIVDVDGDRRRGNGFSFEAYTAEAMLDALGRAARLYRDDSRAWRDVMQRGMAQDLSWKNSARAYQDLYRKLGR